MKSEAGEQTFSSAYLVYLLGLFFLVNVSNYMDRMVLAVLVEPIRLELGLSDTQIGLLTGFAFAAIYAVMGFPIARLADRGNRKRIIAASMVVWSVMTALCGRAQSFAQLFLARMGVGIGEAGCFPAANALIAELFPPQRRSLALGIFMSGATVGMIMGFVVGGMLAEAYGWRMTFFLVGAPGVLIAVIVMLTLRERPLAVVTSMPKTPYLELVRLILASPVYRLVLIGASLGTFATYGMAQWAPAFFIRSHGLSLIQVGTLFGLCYGGGSAVGMMLGGWVADKLTSRGDAWLARVPALAYLLSFPLMVLTFAVESATLALVIVFVAAAFSGSATGPTLAAIQQVTPAQGRATAAAILMFCTSLIGIGAAPFVVGLISDMLQGRLGVESLRYALMLTSVVVLAASLCFFAVIRHFKTPAAVATVLR